MRLELYVFTSANHSKLRPGCQRARGWKFSNLRHSTANRHLRLTKVTTVGRDTQWSGQFGASCRILCFQNKTAWQR
eukprot:1268337-Pleurochrysis_carterae.AAC.1